MKETLPETHPTSQNYKTLTIQLSTVRETTGIYAQSPESILQYLDDIADLAQESLWVLTIDPTLQIINRHLITLGVVDASLAHPREIIRPAILDLASGLILIHNHPSAKLHPSEEDLEITSRVHCITKLMEIDLFDHIIIGKREGKPMQHYSLRQKGHFLKFKKAPIPRQLLEL